MHDYGAKDNLIYVADNDIFCCNDISSRNRNDESGIGPDMVLPTIVMLFSSTRLPKA